MTFKPVKLIDMLKGDLKITINIKKQNGKLLYKLLSNTEYNIDDLRLILLAFNSCIHDVSENWKEINEL